MTSHIGKFEIIRTIGKGAMGEVLLGRDPVLNREVAIKTILAEGGFDEAAKADFEFEARATAVLNHPNIVTVFDFGYHEDKAYLVMEFVDGDTFEVLIANGTPKQLIIEMLAQACDGLAYAHEQGLIHRDIKPGNILVSMRGKKQHAKLVDFGVAQTERGGQPGEGEWAGTIHYMAPEYLKSGKASKSSDLFAIGVILYEILSGGRKPFVGEDTTAVLSAIMSQLPEPLTGKSLDGLPTALLAVVTKALDKEPLNRYADAESLAQAMLNALKPAPAHTTATVKPDLLNVVVGKGGQATCLSLRVALRQAASGAQIRVQPGVYKESILIEKDVIIVGEGDPSKIVIESSGPPAIRVKSGKPTVKDITIRATDEQIDSLVDVADGHLVLKNCLLKTLGNCAVNVEFGANISMHDCIVTGHGRELIALHGEAEVNGGHLSGATKAAVSIVKKGQGTFQYVRMGPGDGVGILMEDQAQASLDNLVLNGFDEGSLELNSSCVLDAKNSQFLSSKFAGLIQSGESKATLENCVFSEHEGAGVNIAGEAEATLKDCKIFENSGCGISVLNIGKAVLDSCQITGNTQTGVVVHQRGKIQLVQSRIVEGKAEGVYCYPGAEANLEFCEIKDNAKHGVQVDSTGYVALKQCVVHDNQGIGLNMGDNADVFLESCVIQNNFSGSITMPEGAKRPTLLGNNHIEAYNQDG